MFKAGEVEVAGTDCCKFTLTDQYNHSLSDDATIMVSKTCLNVGEQVVGIFLDIIG